MKGKDEGKDVVDPLGQADTPFFSGIRNGMSPPSGEHKSYRRELDEMYETVTRQRDTNGAAEPDVYQALMEKERRVLDSIDRIVSSKDESKEDSEDVVRMPIHKIAIKCIATTQNLLDDLVAARSVQEGIRAFTAPERRIYIGIVVALLGVALLLFASW
jgi:hypothetical protein